MHAAKHGFVLCVKCGKMCYIQCMLEYGNDIPVPEIFWSFETGGPMERCGLCNRDLTLEGTNYLIEKAFREGETMFEHALCLHCHLECVEELSAESLGRIQAYFDEHVDLAKRPARLLEDYGTDPRRWLGHCLVKGYPIDECGEYQIYGFCIGRNLIFNGAPYLLSGEAIEDILGLLSSQTLGTLGEISDRLFGIDAPKDLLVF